MGCLLGFLLVCGRFWGGAASVGDKAASIAGAASRMTIEALMCRAASKGGGTLVWGLLGASLPELSLLPPQEARAKAQHKMHEK